MINVLVPIINVIWVIPLILAFNEFRKRNIKYYAIGKTISGSTVLKKQWNKIMWLILLWIFIPLAIIPALNFLPLAYFLILKLAIIIYLTETTFIFYKNVKQLNTHIL